MVWPMRVPKRTSGTRKSTFSGSIASSLKMGSPSARYWPTLTERRPSTPSNGAAMTVFSSRAFAEASFASLTRISASASSRARAVPALFFRSSSARLKLARESARLASISAISAL
jgi:hypothetical protein